MEAFMDELMNKGETMMIVRDFNIWADDEVNSDTTKFLTLMNVYGLTQMIDKPTQIAGHTLDHLYIDKEQIERCRLVLIIIPAS